METLNRIWPYALSLCVIGCSTNSGISDSETLVRPLTPSSSPTSPSLHTSTPPLPMPSSVSFTFDRPKMRHSYSLGALTTESITRRPKHRSPSRVSSDNPCPQLMPRASIFSLSALNLEIPPHRIRPTRSQSNHPRSILRSQPLLRSRSLLRSHPTLRVNTLSSRAIEKAATSPRKSTLRSDLGI